MDRRHEICHELLIVETSSEKICVILINVTERKVQTTTYENGFNSVTFELIAAIFSISHSDVVRSLRITMVEYVYMFRK
jgi:hypothetical protein